MAMRSRNQRSCEIDHGAAGECEHRLFERPQGFNVEVVGRFVEQQHVATGLEQFGQMHTIAFTAGQVADLLLLIRPGS